MPLVMAAELRSPHQRRSDQLSILTRRPPPLQTSGRFSKTLPDHSTLTAFDPTFDSDADTEGPASGSSARRRDFSRILSTSSTGVHSDDVEAVVAAAAAASAAAGGNAGGNIARAMSGDLARGGRSDSEEGIIGGEGGFGRDRARSFYGRRVPLSCDMEGDAPEEIGPVSKATLRRVLDEDYEVYKAGVASKQKDSGQVKEAVVVEAGDEEKGDEQREVKSPAVTEIKGVDGTRVARKARSFQVFGTEVSVSVDSGSRSGSEDWGVSGSEMDRLLAGVEMPRLSAVAVPLFVEEVGRVPRAALVEGKMKRVRVSEEEDEAKRMRGLCGLGWLCLDGARRKWMRRGKRKGAANGEKRFGQGRVGATEEVGNGRGAGAQDAGAVGEGPKV